MNNLKKNIIELIRRTSAELPQDVVDAITQARKTEAKGSAADYALDVIGQNIQLAAAKSAPLCQDTGSILFYVDYPKGFDVAGFEKEARKAVTEATKKGYLRQNSVDSLTGVNDGTNVGPGTPCFHFHPHSKKTLDVKLMLKGGGCENVGAQYSLPDERIGAGRDLNGVRKAILDAVLQAQGKGCGPGILGVTIGGDRATGYAASKENFLRLITDTNPDKRLAELEKDIVETSNQLGIGPMGFGGKTTLLGCKVNVLNRLPASYFVSISYMCWAYRRQGCRINPQGTITQWLY